jgi:hypothetical protein
MNREVVVVTAMVLDYYAALDRLILGSQSQGNLSPNTHTSALNTPNMYWYLHVANDTIRRQVIL